MNPPKTIENKQISRLGFMERDGQVPDDFNSMTSNEIEELFCTVNEITSQQWCSDSFKNIHECPQIGESFDKIYVIWENY